MEDVNEFVIDGEKIMPLDSGNVDLLFHPQTEYFYTRKNIKKNDLPQQTNRMNLRFPSVIQLYYIDDEEGNTLNFYQEFFPYGDLTNFVQHNCAREEDIIRFFYQCSRGLQYLHNNGYIHRDIKPLNIFIDVEKNAALGDLEYSTNNASATSRIKDQEYSAPEVKDNKPNTKKSDIYSIGYTFQDYIHTRVIEEDLKNDLLSVIAQTMVENPDKRISTDELVSQLEEILKKYEMNYIIDEFESRIEPIKNSYTFCKLDDIKDIKDNSFIQDVIDDAMQFL